MSDTHHEEPSFWDKFGWVVIMDICLVLLVGLVLVGYLQGWIGFTPQQ